MNETSWLSGLDHAGRLFIEALPEALGLAYAWARQWQTLLLGVLLIIAARILAQGSVRTARIRASAMIRAAQINSANQSAQPAAVATISESPMTPAATLREVAHRPAEVRGELIERCQHLRSLIRSALAMLAANGAGADATTNLYCDRICKMHFDADTLPDNLPAIAREIHVRLALQLMVARETIESRQPLAKLVDALKELNVTARELISELSPTAADLAQTTSLVRNRRTRAR